MRIFLNGATGFIGSALIPELIKAGHRVLGLTRSDAGAQSLIAAGAEPHRGDLADLESLRAGAAQADGVIHTAFNHDDFSKFHQSCEQDGRVIEAMGSVLMGSNRPFVITSGVGMGTAVPGQLATEDHFDAGHPNPRKASEVAGAALLERGVNVSVVRLPQVHDPVKQGLITCAVQVARQKGVSAYVAEGLNRWPAVHVHDAALLYRLAFDKAEAGAKVSRGGGRRHLCSRDRGGDRPRLEGAGGLAVCGGSGESLGMAGRIYWLGYAGFQGTNAATARMASDRSQG